MRIVLLFVSVIIWGIWDRFVVHKSWPRAKRFIMLREYQPCVTVVHIRFRDFNHDSTLFKGLAPRTDLIKMDLLLMDCIECITLAERTGYINRF